MMNERQIFLKKNKRNEKIILIIQISILFTILLLWELLSRFNIINSFLLSSPSKIFKTLIELFKNNSLLLHIYTTFYEIIISFILGNIIGLIFASILWINENIFKIFDPYLTILNSLPKVSLGPLIIIICGANTKSIIIMSLLISSILSIINIYNSFKNTDKNRITIVKSMGANKFQIFTKVILPSNYLNIIDSFKINISMCFVGVIMGELLVSKKGIGYLINYGSQIFNMNLVITGIFLLIILTIIFYLIIYKIEKAIKK